jgi:hypothetical protein
MGKRLVAVGITMGLLGLGGCASNPLSNSLSSLQVCTQSVGILTEMEEVLRLALANPLAASTYTERLSELSDEFAALEPLDQELAAAHNALSSQIETVLATVANPSVAAITELPTLVAETQIALLDYTEACTP